MPRAVARELALGRAQGLPLPDPSTLPWTSVREAREQNVLKLVTDLGSGEREPLALAAELPGSLIILDDALARHHARLLGISFTGTLGVLLKAKREGKLALVRPAVDRLESLRFFLDPATRAAVLGLAGEPP